MRTLNKEEVCASLKLCCQHLAIPSASQCNFVPVPLNELSVELEPSSVPPSTWLPLPDMPTCAKFVLLKMGDVFSLGGKWHRKWRFG